MFAFVKYVLPELGMRITLLLYKAVHMHFWLNDDLFGRATTENKKHKNCWKKRAHATELSAQKKDDLNLWISTHFCEYIVRRWHVCALTCHAKGCYIEAHAKNILYYISIFTAPNKAEYRIIFRWIEFRFFFSFILKQYNGRESMPLDTEYVFTFFNLVLRTTMRFMPVFS